MAKYSTIPTVDLSPFFDERNDDDAKNKARELIGKACAEYGFFVIVNHGVPAKLMSRALELSRYFFQLSAEEKLKSKRRSVVTFPVGYSKIIDHSVVKKESLRMFPPGSSLNIFPQNPAEFREVLEELFTHFAKAGQMVENVLNESLGLPPNFLQEYNHDRSDDFMNAIHYVPETEIDIDGLHGIEAHEDPSSITFVLQDDIGGLQVLKDEEWIPIIPREGTLVVNVGDVIQVLSNKKFKSATHRVLRPKGISRYSFSYFYSLQGDKWVEPLTQFTTAIGEEPKYKGYYKKDYHQMLMEKLLLITI